MNPLLNGMNDRQAQAVQTTEGPLLLWRGLVLVKQGS
ncbi:Superfamily I DNA and RNA helicase [Streptococcus pyogenes]|nr:Superfamily I DNA and RNA helicase [Streptococcus pyogenes]